MYGLETGPKMRSAYRHAWMMRHVVPLWLYAHLLVFFCFVFSPSVAAAAHTPFLVVDVILVLVVMEDRRVFWGGGGREGATRFRVFSDIFYEAHSRWLLPYVLVQSSFVGPATKTLDRFLGGIFSRKFWGWRGQKFLGKKNVS